MTENKPTTKLSLRLTLFTAAYAVWFIALHLYWIQHLCANPIIHKGLRQCLHIIGR